jgi:hypothetical protein
VGDGQVGEDMDDERKDDSGQGDPFALTNWGATSPERQNAFSAREQPRNALGAANAEVSDQEPAL